VASSVLFDEVHEVLVGGALELGTETMEEQGHRGEGRCQGLLRRLIF
jgi:hypothetical protein